MSYSVFFLGKQKITPYHYIFTVRLSLSPAKYYKCELIIKKRNNVFYIHSLGKIEEKMKEDFVKHNEEWKLIKYPTKNREIALKSLENDRFLKEVIEEAKWEIDSVTTHVQGDKPYGKHNLKENGDHYMRFNFKFSVSEKTYKVHICYLDEVNYIEHLEIAEDENGTPAHLLKPDQYLKDLYLGEILMNELQKELNNKVRLNQLLN